MSHSIHLLKNFGTIDIYLFDQLLKGRFDQSRRILDAGCGSGRNLVYFLQNSFEVYGIDQSPAAIAQVQQLASTLAPDLPPENFAVARTDNLPFADARFDVVLSSAVLHFARDEKHFQRMLKEMWRVLKSGGILFARLASNIGIETRTTPIEGRRHLLPDGTERFLVDEAYLLDLSKTLGGRLLEPLKTTNVQNKRCMTTWIVRKEDM